MVLLVFFGRSSRAKPGRAVAPDRDNNGRHVVVGCTLNDVEKPMESFHDFYQDADASTSVDEEAHVTPRTLEVTIKNPSGAHAYHAVRSDEVSWSTAVLDLPNLACTALTGRAVALMERL